MRLSRNRIWTLWRIFWWNIPEGWTWRPRTVCGRSMKWWHRAIWKWQSMSRNMPLSIWIWLTVRETRCCTTVYFLKTLNWYGIWWSVWTLPSAKPTFMEWHLLIWPFLWGLRRYRHILKRSWELPRRNYTITLSAGGCIRILLLWGWERIIIW